MTKEAFVALVTADPRRAPISRTRGPERKERQTLDVDSCARTERYAHHVLALQQVGGQLLDTRDPGDFAAAHLVGSVNVGLGGQFATWAGTVLTRERPIVIVADPGRESESAVRLGRIGFDHVVGYLDGGLRSAESRPDLTATTERLRLTVAAERLARGETRAPLAIRREGPGEREQNTWPAASAFPSITSPTAA